jgi:hypothetical protein
MQTNASQTTVAQYIWLYAIGLKNALLWSLLVSRVRRSFSFLLGKCERKPFRSETKKTLNENRRTLLVRHIIGTERKALDSRTS